MRTSFRWRALAGGAVGAGLIAVVVRSVMAGPLQAASAKDAAEASHDVQPAAGTAAEERVKLPDGDWIAGNAIVEPADRETRVAAVVAGTISAIHVHEGDVVDQGQVLLELESSTAKAALDAADGELALARAELTRVAMVCGARTSRRSPTTRPPPARALVFRRAF